jgi:hypothetical protein
LTFSKGFFRHDVRGHKGWCFRHGRSLVVDHLLSCSGSSRPGLRRWQTFLDQVIAEHPARYKRIPHVEQRSAPIVV